MVSHDFDDDGGAAFEAEMGYERYLESRDPEGADQELRAWSEEWPNGYARCNEVVGCRRQVYHSGDHIFEDEEAGRVDEVELAAMLARRAEEVR